MAPSALGGSRWSHGLSTPSIILVSPVRVDIPTGSAPLFVARPDRENHGRKPTFIDGQRGGFVNRS